MAYVIDQVNGHTVRGWFTFKAPRGALWNQRPFEAECSCGKTWKGGAPSEVEVMGRRHCAAMADQMTAEGVD